MKKLLIVVIAIHSVLCAEFKLGIENITDSFVQKFGNGKRIGLITNQTGIDSQKNRNVDILLKKGIQVCYLFAPEHGIDGKVDAGKKVDDSVDQHSRIPVFSLYGNGTGKCISPDHLKNIDVLMFDMQDSGMRHYTYISTLMQVMKIASEHKKSLVVFDRPNYLGRVIEGPCVDDNHRSFISIANIPLRHGMTIGEIAWFFNKYELKVPADLHVVTMQDYNHENSVLGSGKELLISPSSGLRTVQACLGYSFVGILGEVRPIAIGLRTNHPFHCIMLPEKINFKKSDWAELQAILKKEGISSVMHSYVDDKSKTPFVGLRLNIQDIHTISSFKTLYRVLTFFKKKNVPLEYSKTFDKSVGVPKFREVLEDKSTYAQLKDKVNNQLEEFYRKSKDIFMYNPHPKVFFMK